MSPREGREKLNAQKQYAPVVITTCNRLAKLRSLLKSLRDCKNSKKTRIYIFVDAPFSPKVKEKNQKILSMIKTLRGFKKINIIKRKKNLGPGLNLEKALNRVLKKSKTAIFLEDDNIVSKNFLLFMNQALTHFQNDKRCFAVSGYNYVRADLNKTSTDIYTAPYFSAWGVGFFQDRYFPVHQMLRERPDPFFMTPAGAWKTFSKMPHLFRIYMESWLQKKVYHDVLYSLYCLKKKMYCAFPVATKVINEGYDGSGVNCGVSIQKFHHGFEAQDKKQFICKPDFRINRVFWKKNRVFFRQHFNGTPRHLLSLYWRYFTRVLGLRPLRC